MNDIIKIERTTPIYSGCKVISLNDFTQIDTNDIIVESIVIDLEEKKVLIHYHE